MYKNVNGKLIEMTEAEIAEEKQKIQLAKAEEKSRPLTAEEVTAMLIRQQINGLTVDDQTAYRMKEFYPEWAAGEAYAVGYKLLYGGKLYKVLQAHTSQETWLPDISASLYARIDEAHDGTEYDPIPYDGNMALENGKHYSQGGVTYRGTRDTVNPVYQPLAELVGLYVEAA